MCNNIIHYDYCRCCGVWMKAAALDEENLCRFCWGQYGDDWPAHKKATAAPLSDEL